jgi:Cu+-exporting ATPase
MKKQRIVISGMTCTACAKAIERSVGKLEGVHSANVNFATEKLDVEYDENIVDIDRINKAINKAGYEAWDEEKQERQYIREKGSIINIVESKKQADTDKERKEKEIRLMWTRFVVALVFTIPLLYIAMGSMIGLYLPDIISPEKSPVNFAISQLILTLPVIIAGYKFYTVGFNRLFKGEPNMDSLIAIGNFLIKYGCFS